MITETIISEVAGTKLTKMSISRVPTWIDKNHQEGLELQGGVLKPFWLVAGERKYTEPVSDSMSKLIKEINTFSDFKPEQKRQPEQSEGAENDKTTSLLPDFLTPALMSKWGTMSTTDRVLMFQKTPADKIDHVKVSKDESAAYVKGNYMIKEANAAFLFDWYLTDIKITVGTKGVSVSGILYAWFTEYNKYLSRPATGYQELNSLVDTELAKKGATTDAIKKGLSLFGFNSDVYSGERN